MAITAQEFRDFSRVYQLAIEAFNPMRNGVVVLDLRTTRTTPRGAVSRFPYVRSHEMLNDEFAELVRSGTPMPLHPRMTQVSRRAIQNAIDRIRGDADQSPNDAVAFTPPPKPTDEQQAAIDKKNSEKLTEELAKLFLERYESKPYW